uniref:Uncharacterized protein n=1 Tax=Lygus hesperus TaxID=30085 RepID=A0A146LLM7_LYGHE
MRTLNEKLLSAVPAAVTKSGESSVTHNTKTVHQPVYSCIDEALSEGSLLCVYDAQGVQTGVGDITQLEEAMRQGRQQRTEDHERLTSAVNNSCNNNAPTQRSNAPCQLRQETRVSDKGRGAQYMY